MIVDVARVRVFLASRFGDDIGDVAPLGAGVWSKAFAFRWAGRDYVIRFGQYQEDFAKDRLAARYASPALPISRLVELGATDEGYDAISERVFGHSIDDVGETEMRALLPSLFAALDAARLAALSGRPATGAGAPMAARHIPAGKPRCWTWPTIYHATVHTVGANAWWLRQWVCGRSSKPTRSSRRSPGMSLRSAA